MRISFEISEDALIEALREDTKIDCSSLIRKIDEEVMQDWDFTINATKQFLEEILENGYECAPEQIREILKLAKKLEKEFKVWDTIA
jgi:hypothetical protein